LTARRRLRADRLPTFALSRSGLGHRERRSFLGCRQLRRIEPSDTSHQRPVRGRMSALETDRLGLPSSRARQCADLSEARGAFRRERHCRRPFRAPSCALPPLAGGAVAARFHRCSKNLD
jgi:hypothetical protein